LILLLSALNSLLADDYCLITKAHSERPNLADICTLHFSRK